MKIVFAGLVMLAASVSVNASGMGDRDLHHGHGNAPVCPDGEHPVFLGVIDGKATWRCVPN